MDIFRELAAGIASMLAVLTSRCRTCMRIQSGDLFHILKYYSVSPVLAGFCGVFFSPGFGYWGLKQGGEVPGFPGFLFYSVLFSGVFMSIVRYNIFAKKDRREQERITTLCGAVCSECLYFLEGVCPSCPEGDPAVRESCLLFKCARKRETVCHVCERLMRCELYAQERDKCPFESDLFSLHTGVGYVIYEKNAEESIELLKNHVNRGEFGLLISRRFPEQIMAKYHLESVATIWMSTSEGEDNWIDPSDLSKLHHRVTDFIRNAPVSTILFEGFEYLMVRNSFLTALKFVQSLMDEVTLNKSRLLLSINPDAFDRSQLALIRRELIEL
jgi:hypothetical protein